MLPDDKSEIPTSEVARHYTHIKRVADKIPALDPSAAILILLGRDIRQALKVRGHINGTHKAPYAQHLDLGWIIVGEVCLGRVHKPEHANVYRTNVLSNGRTSLFDPCTNSLHLKEKFDTSANCHGPPKVNEMKNLFEKRDSLGEGVFQRTPDDDKPAMSVED